MKSKFFRRSRYIINPAFQLKCLLTVIIYIVFYSIILGFSIFFPLYLEFNSNTSPETHAWVSTLTLQLHQRVWPAVLVVVILAPLHVIFSTHKIAGPLFKFQMMFNELLKGDFSKRLHFRKGDHLKELEFLFNRLSEYLGNVQSHESQFREEIQRKLDTVSQKLSANNEQSAKEAHEMILSLINQLESSPSVFSVHKDDD